MSAIQVQLQQVHVPTFDPYLGISFSDFSCWSDGSNRIFAGFSAMSRGDIDEGLRILGGEGDGHTSVNSKMAAQFSDLAKQHYYASTALIQLVQSSQELVEIDVSNFIWIVEDNPFAFEVISTVKGMFHSIEGACAYAHFNAEVLAGHAIAEPQVEKAKQLYGRRSARPLRLINP